MIGRVALGSAWITGDEVDAVIRAAGSDRIEDVAAVAGETNATPGVIRRGERELTALRAVTR